MFYAPDSTKDSTFLLNMWVPRLLRGLLFSMFHVVTGLPPAVRSFPRPRSASRCDPTGEQVPAPHPDRGANGGGVQHQHVRQIQVKRRSTVWQHGVPTADSS